VKEPKRFRVVELQGTHYEMGLQYGAECRGLIRRLLRRLDGLLLKPETVERGREVARQAVAQVREAAPELLEEVEGIAEGAGVSFDDAFRLSCSVELHSWQGCVDRQEVSTVPEGCSSFAVRRGRSSLVAWNMDWWRVWQPFIVLLRGRPIGEPRFMAFALAGSVGRPGMSEQIAMAANFLPYRAKADAPAGGAAWGGPGVPYNFISRMLLQQPSVDDALDLLARVRRMACLNYTLGDSRGRICCVETLPSEYAVLEAQDSFLVHANSYHSPRLGGIPEAEQRQRDPRAFYARELLRNHAGQLDRPAVYAVQRTHFPGQRTGICVHNKAGRDSITLLSFVADLQDQTMWAAYGSPCRHRFLPYKL